MTIRRTVKRVIDGDTFEVARKIQGTNRIRIAGLNAPELRQKGYSEAKNRLRRLIGSKQVTIVPVGRSCNRLVAQVRRNRKKIR